MAPKYAYKQYGEEPSRTDRRIRQALVVFSLF